MKKNYKLMLIIKVVIQ